MQIKIDVLKNWNTVINPDLNGNTLDYSESGNSSPVSCGLDSQKAKKKIANGFKKGIQVFFAAMVLFGDNDGPSLSRSRLRAPDSRDGRQFPGSPNEMAGSPS